jgi:hypothetical protein
VSLRGLSTLCLPIVDLISLKIEDFITAVRLSVPTQRIQNTVLILNLQYILNAMFSEGAVVVGWMWKWQYIASQYDVMLNFPLVALPGYKGLVVGLLIIILITETF